MVASHSDSPCFKIKPSNEFKSNVNKETFLKAITMCQKLKQDLQRQYGQECIFYPEIAVTCKTQQEILGSDRIYGIIDLLIIDEKGIPHLIDYKTSTKTYNNFHETKKQAYTYQLAVYERILANYGIRTSESTSTIVPIQLKDMKYDPNEQKWIYSDIIYNMLNQDTVQQEEIKKVKDEKVVSNINKFLPSKVKLSLHSEKLMENVTKSLKVLFPHYQIQRGSTDEELLERLRREGAFEVNPKTGYYQFSFGISGEPIRVPADDPNPELSMLKKVRAEIDSWTVSEDEIDGIVKFRIKYLFVIRI